MTVTHYTDTFSVTDLLIYGKLTPGETTLPKTHLGTTVTNLDSDISVFVMKRDVKQPTNRRD